MTGQIPKTQTALELTGPDELKLNRQKPVTLPGPHQILCEVEAVGLCFSDLKLLKQFDKHARKSEIISGIDADVLKSIHSYVSGRAPTVPGHEAVVKIAAVGREVEKYSLGQRFLVQTDYRWLKTENANAAFGYNFEGALQQYVLMDERVITSPQGESFLIPASEKLSAAAVALVEPWACVEDAYETKERRQIKQNGTAAIVAERNISGNQVSDFFQHFGKPAKIFCTLDLNKDLSVPVTVVKDIAQLPDASLDDVIYFGSNPQAVEELLGKIAAGGLFNIVLSGRALERPISCNIGRTHYGGIRIIGTAGDNPAESMRTIPETGEVRKGDKIDIVGAAGPMGLMHVVRDICLSAGGLQIFAGDLDGERLELLNRIAEPLARKNNVDYIPYDPAKDKLQQQFDYIVIMAPVPALVSKAISQARQGAIINIFAGISADVTARIDLDTYIKKQAYFIGTSGSTIQDMKTVLEKVLTGRLDTNLSVAAVCGLDFAADGIKAVENRLIAGKIIVYPDCKGLPLMTLQQLGDKMPDVARNLKDGVWNLEAENAMLAMY